MADKASRKTDELLSELEKELENQYNLTDKEIQAAIEEYLNAIYLADQEDATQNQRLKYAQKNGLDDIVEIFVIHMLTINERAVNRINDTMNIAGDINYDYIRQSIKNKTNKDIGGKADKYKATKYSKRSYNRLEQKKYVSDEILKELKKGIKKGEGIPDLSKRVRKVSSRSKNNARLVARTESTRISNLNRLEAMQEVKDIGIKFNKVWISTNDKRTRHSHAMLNGETIDNDKTFSNGGLYPGDPNLPPEEICNCRCTMTYRLE